MVMISIFENKLRSELICPYCMRVFPLKEFYFCTKCGENFAKIRFGKMICGVQNCEGGVNPEFIVKCPFTKSESESICGEDIPQAVLDAPYFSFSIVGVPSSGKSNFITVMLKELENISSSGLQLAVSPINTKASDIQNENSRIIFKDHKRLPPTDKTQPPPQIWQLKNRQRMEKDFCPTYTFTIFDGAGEHSIGRANESVTRYISTSEAIIITIDPLTLDNVRGKIDSKVLNNSQAYEGASATKALQFITDELLRKSLKIGSGVRLDIPVAVVLTKFDVILDEKNESFGRYLGKDAKSRIKKTKIEDGKVNISEMQSVSKDIRDFLLKLEEGNFVYTVEGNFKNMMFFGVSSYGKPPIDSDTLDGDITPQGVLDPILWLLHLKKFID